MRQKPGTRKSHGEKVVKDIRRAARKQYSAEEKIRIVLDGLKGEDSIAELCRLRTAAFANVRSCPLPEQTPLWTRIASCRLDIATTHRWGTT